MRAIPRRAILYALYIALCFAAAPASAQAPPADTTAVDTPRQMLEPVGRFASDLFDFSTANLQEKAGRILVIVLISLIAKFFMDAVQIVSRFLVYSQWGPLKYIFRNRQRSITVHALFINLLKYVVYFTALGYILKELGVDYTVYLASLSLIGIAIGFGSQGLVQDIVTGFFILFENQFSVGDMVEISGQVGIVEDIGLRTTRLRNYFGAQIIFQNRNIPMAGRYKKGGFEVAVDVAVTGPEAAPKAAELLQRIGLEVQKQFPEIILAPPRIPGLVELETGEYFVRLQTKIWPLQQWVIDTQMLPRIRELFKRENIEIPSDRVVPFYHMVGEAPEDQPAVQSIRRIVQRAAGSVDFFHEE